MGIARWTRRRVHDLIDSGVWIALIAVVLTAAAARALDLRPAFSVLAMVALGSFAVFSLDRLADRVRDRATKPRRGRFVDRYTGFLLSTALVAAAIAGLLALLAGPGVSVLMALVAALAALHLPLKRSPGVKPTYIAAAWLLVVVGLPVVVGRIVMAADGDSEVWVTLI